MKTEYLQALKFNALSVGEWKMIKNVLMAALLYLCKIEVFRACVIIAVNKVKRLKLRTNRKG
jgi:hypothetical protein